MQPKDIDAHLKRSTSRNTQEGIVIDLGMGIARVKLLGSRQNVVASCDPSITVRPGDHCLAIRSPTSQTWIITTVFPSPVSGRPGVTANAISQSGTFVIVPILELGGDAASLDTPVFANDYDILEIEGMWRTDRANNDDLVVIRLNEDATAANYITTQNVGIGSGQAASTIFTAATGLVMAYAAAANSPSGYYGYMSAKITCRPDYPKMMNFQGGTERTTSSFWIASGSGVWENVTDPITRISFVPGTGPNFVAGSWVTVRGVRYR